MSASPPRFCVVKEGRLNGEVAWNGQDGYYLVRNELNVLTAFEKAGIGAPKVFSSFEVNGNFYFVMEYLEGQTLNEIIKIRRRRFSLRQITKFGIEIARILDTIHKAGWVWNDCKPANLLVTAQGVLRPIDFEGAHRIDRSNTFNWMTKGFSRPVARENATPAEKISEELYSLGAVIYFLITGQFHEPAGPDWIRRSRRNIPKEFRSLLTKLLGNTRPDERFNAVAVELEFQNILRSI